MTRTKALSEKPRSWTFILCMVISRAEASGFNPSRVCSHTFRGTGLTAYLENGGDLETAQHVAGHALTNMTRIYEYRNRKVVQEGIERMRI